MNTRKRCVPRRPQCRASPTHGCTDSRPRGPRSRRGAAHRRDGAVTVTLRVVACGLGGRFAAAQGVFRAPRRRLHHAPPPHRLGHPPAPTGSHSLPAPPAATAGAPCPRALTAVPRGCGCGGGGIGTAGRVPVASAAASGPSPASALTLSRGPLPGHPADARRFAAAGGWFALFLSLPVRSLEGYACGFWAAGAVFASHSVSAALLWCVACTCACGCARSPPHIALKPA